MPSGIGSYGLKRRPVSRTAEASAAPPRASLVTLPTPEWVGSFSCSSGMVNPRKRMPSIASSCDVSHSMHLIERAPPISWSIVTLSTIWGRRERPQSDAGGREGARLRCVSGGAGPAALAPCSVLSFFSAACFSGMSSISLCLRSEDEESARAPTAIRRVDGLAAWRSISRGRQRDAAAIRAPLEARALRLGGDVKLMPRVFLSPREIGSLPAHQP